MILNDYWAKRPVGQVTPTNLLNHANEVTNEFMNHFLQRIAGLGKRVSVNWMMVENDKFND